MRTCRIVDVAVPADQKEKLKENEKKGKCLNLARNVKKKMVHESDGDINCNWCACYIHQRLDKGNGGLVNKRMTRDHPSDSIIKIGQNTADICRLAVTQNPVWNHQLNLGLETLKRE